MTALPISQFFDLVTGIRLIFETSPLRADEDPPFRCLGIREITHLENGHDLQDAIAGFCSSRSGSIAAEAGRVSLVCQDGDTWYRSIYKAWDSYDLPAAGMDFSFPFSGLQLSPAIRTFANLAKTGYLNVHLPAQWDKGNVYRFNIFLNTAREGFSLKLISGMLFSQEQISVEQISEELIF